LNKQRAASAAQTIDGGLQMARICIGLIANGVSERDEAGNPIPDKTRACTLDDIKAECDKQLGLLEPKLREAQNTIVAMDGQIAGFRCSSSWAEHYARGGKLE
jgi:hypothetical protein